MNQQINPENVQRICEWTRALLQGLARYQIASEEEQAIALRMQSLSPAVNARRS